MEKGSVDKFPFFSKQFERFWLRVIIGAVITLLFAIFLYTCFPNWAIGAYNNHINKKECPKHCNNTNCIQNKTTESDAGDSGKIDTGPIGDTFGGTAGPLVALIAAFFTFLAFYVQYQANQNQREDIKLERFENKFYELLRLHRQNLDETRIEGFRGKFIERRKAFVAMFNEFRFAFLVTKKIYDHFTKLGILDREVKDEELIRLAYIFFYAGVGSSSDIVSKAMVGSQFHPRLVSRLMWYFKAMQQRHTSRTEEEIIIPGYGEAYLTIKYKAFQGHMSRLGHYYRHLFQTVKYVVNENGKLLTPEEVTDYLRTLRAQLSDFEQLLLYYNALSGFGAKWIDNKYFTEYRMIHNMPRPLAWFGIKPGVKFEKEIDHYRKKNIELFEWPRD